MEQHKEFFDSLRSQPLDNIVILYGPPARELGPFKRERIHWDGKVEVVDYRRVLGFLGKGSTAHILWIYERSDRGLEFFYTVDITADPCVKKEDHSKYVA